jgi:hypothetical protein
MSKLRNDIEETLVRVAMGLRLPGQWFGPRPDASRLAARTGTLEIEIVSHCWNYAHMLAYQLSSLVLFAPARARVRMTVCHAREDRATCELLEWFGAQQAPGVTWNWVALAPGELFRRAIGRHRVSLATTADWLWFTDCDIVFHRDCLDTLADRLQGRRDLLAYPKEERVTPMMAADDPRLAARGGQLIDIDTSDFTLVPNPPKAKGAYQIVHGDVARQCGYCGSLPVFQRPAPRWAKTYEDAAFRWLLGSDGVGLDVPGVYRLRHAAKGRYGDNQAMAAVRGGIRRAKANLEESQ